MRYTYIDTPIGTLLLAGSEKGLQKIGFPEGKGQVTPGVDWQEDDHTFTQAIEELTAYFAGELTRFTTPVIPQGTPFQQSVWQALQQITYGTTTSYRNLAVQLERPKAMRAVGAANGRNPIPIIIPCHRVIGSNGNLTGFAGGLATKAYLLDLEKQHAQAASA